MDIHIRDASIGLGQFLKLAGLAETGGHAKELIAAGKVLVNGSVETRRGHSLVHGDTVETPLGEAVVCAAGKDE